MFLGDIERVVEVKTGSKSTFESALYITRLESPK